MSMYQLTYISTGSPGIGDADVAAILESSRRNNGQDDVTGILIYDGKRFLQALEGPSAAVDSTYRRIRNDPRHRATVQLSLRTIETREFGSWDMAYQSGGPVSGRTIAEDVDALVARVPDANTRALFSGFVRLKR